MCEFDTDVKTEYESNHHDGEQLGLAMMNRN